MDGKSKKLWDTGNGEPDTGVGQPTGKYEESGVRHSADSSPTPYSYENRKKEIIVAVITAPGCHTRSHMEEVKRVYDLAFHEGFKHAKRS